MTDVLGARTFPKLTTAIAQAIRAASQPVAQPPTWPVPVIAAVLVAAIGIVGAGVYKNSDRIDANRDRIDALSDRVSSLEVSMSERISSLEISIFERFTRIETLLEERLPERR